jgi:hypothetical protein
MENFILNKNTNQKDFTFTSSESSLRIHRVSLSFEENSKSNWIEIISKLSLNVELKYVVYTDEAGRFVDERKIVIPINLSFNSDHLHPVFDINQVIKNETFTIGLNTEKKFYTDLKFKLTENSIVEENYSLQVQVEIMD